jgi:hypothetical protein
VGDAAVHDYASGATSFVVGLTPSEAAGLDVEDVLRILRARLGDTLDVALATAADRRPPAPADLPPVLRSPVADRPDGSWLRRSNIVGINVRTVVDIAGVLAYALTVPAAQDAIHLLPILEPGVVASLYGPSSWQLDPALRNDRLARAAPGLDTAERQVRAVVHVLHALDRTVGIDVVPHTDRFSEMVLAQPDHFEWLERHGERIARFGPDVVADVERWILRWLAARGPAIGPPAPPTADEFFRDWSESDRLLALFGEPGDHDRRRERRILLIRDLHPAGIETVPATMGPPYRGMEVDPSPTARIVDDLGLEWREYRITRPEPMSRVFGPLARYALYHTVAPDAWALDFDRPREAVWRYVASRYAGLREHCGFDFMRGDMAHVQMRPDGVPAEPGPTYDILAAVRDEVRHRRGVPSFAYLAETFLAPPGTMAYGDEADHLDAVGADATLGDLQSHAVDDPTFSQALRRYRDLHDTRSFTPTFTVMTADKDDPRFDRFYLAGNEARLFTALFLPDMPSYMGLGFELRDRHASPVPNEWYTKLYVFRRTSGPTATRGPYRWGSNTALFAAVTRIRLLADSFAPVLAEATVTWLRPPDATGSERLIAWQLDGGGSGPERLLCLVNLDTVRPTPACLIPGAAVANPASRWAPVFSTEGEPGGSPSWNGIGWPVDALAPGEARLYRAC